MSTVLGDISIKPGDTILLQGIGDFAFTLEPHSGDPGQYGDYTQRNMWGVFSSSANLAADDVDQEGVDPNRVVDAVPSDGLPIFIGDALGGWDTVDDPLPGGAEPTNIEEDFVISQDPDSSLLYDEPGVTVVVPEGASHLFVGAGDVQWWDNTLTKSQADKFQLRITLLSKATYADFDKDGDIDGFDFLKWQRGETHTPLSAEDLALWKSHFGMTGSPTIPQAEAVPEPSAVASFFTCLGTLLAISNCSARGSNRGLLYCSL